VHQLLAHDSKFNPATVISKFIDGLREDIRAVVLIHRSENLDTASSLALLQEELTVDLMRKEPRRSEGSSSYRFNSRVPGNSGYLSNFPSAAINKTQNHRREDSPSSVIWLS
jgi:hypothetical protein